MPGAAQTIQTDRGAEADRAWYWLSWNRQPPVCEPDGVRYRTRRAYAEEGEGLPPMPAPASLLFSCSPTTTTGRSPAGGAVLARTPIFEPIAASGVRFANACCEPDCCPAGAALATRPFRINQLLRQRHRLRRQRAELNAPGWASRTISVAAIGRAGCRSTTTTTVSPKLLGMCVLDDKGGIEMLSRLRTTSG